MKRFVFGAIALLSLILSTQSFADGGSGPSGGVIAISGDCVGSGHTTIPVSCVNTLPDVWAKKTLGLKGDGVTDDTPVLQAYLNTFTGTVGPTIHFEHLSEFVIAGLVMPKARVNFICESNQDTLFFLPNGANTYMIADYSWVNNLTTSVGSTHKIINCGFNGNRAHQTGSTALIITQSEFDIYNSNITGAVGDAVVQYTTDSDGTSCQAGLGNSKYFDNKVSSLNGRAFAFVNGACSGGTADIWFSRNIINATNAVGGCDAGRLNYAIYTDGGAGFAYNNNVFFANTGCGDIHQIGIAHNQVSDNKFDATSNVGPSGQPVIGVLFETGGPSNWGGLVLHGNSFKSNTTTLPGSATSFNFVSVVSAGGAGTFTGSLCVCGGNSFFANNMAVTTITYTGSHVGDMPLTATGNSYSINAPEPSDPNIYNGPSFADVHSLPTTLAGYGITDAQPLDADLTAFAGLTSGADLLAYYTGSHAMATTGCNSVCRSLLNQTTASAERTQLGVAIGSNVEAWSANLDAVAALTSPATLISGAAQKSNNGSDFANLVTFRSNVGLAIGTNIEAWDCDLDAVAAMSATLGIVKRTGACLFGLAVAGTDYAEIGSNASITALNSLASGSCSAPSLAWQTNYGFEFNNGNSSIGTCINGIELLEQSNNGTIQTVPGGTTSSYTIEGEGTTKYVLGRFSNDAASAGTDCDKARGTIASPALAAMNDDVCLIAWKVWTGAAFHTCGNLEPILVETGTVSNSAAGMDLQINLCAIGSGTTVKVGRWFNDGGLVIGNPTGGDKGISSLNATTVYENGTSLVLKYAPIVVPLNTSVSGAVAKSHGGYGGTTALSLPWLLARGNVDITSANSTSEQAYATITIPANTLGSNGCLIVDFISTYTNGAGTKQFVVRFSGASGTVFYSATGTTTASLEVPFGMIKICNRNATNAQIGAALQTSPGVSSASVVTASVDTTASTSIVISVIKSVGTDVATLNRYDVWVSDD